MLENYNITMEYCSIHLDVRFFVIVHNNVLIIQSTLQFVFKVHIVELYVQTYKRWTIGSPLL